jgi:hypothetical protein
VLAVKYRSGNLSLLKSPTATPPPLYKNSISIGLMESFSTMILLKSIPVCAADNFLNNTGSVLQEDREKITATIIAKETYFRTIVTGIL